MKRLIATISSLVACLFAITTFSGCGDDEGGGNRFEGKSEAEMFEIVKDVFCDFFKRCPEAWDPDNPPAEVTDEMCDQALNDARAYQDPIDEATREALDACLDLLEEAPCEGTGEAPPSECETVAEYLDLK